jgi:DNA-nicking Smr family endonuclease
LNPAQQSAVAAAKADLRQPPFLGKSREKALRQGEIEIEARIDLHGMTQARAQTALARFIAAQVKTKRRHVLIITGKGRAGSGILRANLAGWLESLPEAACILALRPAALRHGGDGAWYVILRARRG